MARTPQSDQALNTAERNGFPYSERMIHLFIGGSGLHGGRIEGKNDDDYYGIFIQPEDKVIGLSDYPHYVWSTSGDSARNQPGDVDITFYSLRKWAGLAAGGNPTALGFLFAPNLMTGTLWGEVRDHAMLFAAKQHYAAFEGFARQQLERCMGTRGKGKHGQRPELEQKFGYDTKALMHVIRLLGEGIEYMSTGRITYPRPDKALLIDIRLGKYDKDVIADQAGHLFNDLKDAAAQSSLPEEVDRDKISALVTETYLRYWGRAGSWHNSRLEYDEMQKL